MKQLRWWLLPLLCAWLGVAAALERGDQLAPWTLLDQHDQAYTLDDNLQVLLVARGMDAADLVQQALSGMEPGYLEQQRVVFLADISGMPGPIASLFAVPAMRDYGYRVILDRTGRVASRYPGEKAELLWLQLDAGRLQEQRSFTQAGELRTALAGLGR
ncbi:FAD/FMN-containing dehydrogenase [Pseudomonas sp. Gutcm_11s]|uniref:FAD/FMN-containing dehydrogenase n=1 Tax=Pseudomonas sp. Gutcm_11s TaxID=3026088 RepID=UPI00235FDCB7|nr:FAD/FMN-containing dehydrogenase [Pseudomonas sp. Gutcm_11s]MDD0844541.1 FAD/FMN-containing dehydrogenase [Pseudomonas sp. Gutcm_11s]